MPTVAPVLARFRATEESTSYAPVKRSGNIRPMGDAAELRVHDDSLKAGAGRERLPFDARGTFGERLPLPRL